MSSTQNERQVLTVRCVKTVISKSYHRVFIQFYCAAQTLKCVSRALLSKRQGERVDDPHLQQLSFHRGCDGGGVDKLEGRGSVVRVLRRELHQHLDAMVATVHGHGAAPIRGIHLQRTNCQLLWRQTTENPYMHVDH